MNDPVLIVLIELLKCFVGPPITLELWICVWMHLWYIIYMLLLCGFAFSIKSFAIKLQQLTVVSLPLTAELMTNQANLW